MTRYAVRMHSVDTEDAIHRQSTNMQRMEFVAPVRPADFSANEGQDDFSEVEQLILDKYLLFKKKKYDGISDPRVNVIDLSVGYRMLQIAGLAEQNCPIRHPDVKMFAGFREKLEKYATGSPMDKDQRKEFKQAAKDLYKYVLANAAIVVGTPGGISHNFPLSVFRYTASTILVDELAQFRDDELMPLFAARFSRCGGIIGFGDVAQLPPYVSSKQPENPYAKTIELSLMVRLTTCGFPGTALTQQTRMLPSILVLSNYLSYNGTIIDSDRVKNRENQAFVKLFRDFNPPYFGGVVKNVVWLDIPGGRENDVKIDQYKSRYCLLYAIIVVIDHVKKILNRVNKKGSVKVAIVTAYGAQRTILSESD